MKIEIALIAHKSASDGCFIVLAEVDADTSWTASKQRNLAEDLQIFLSQRFENFRMIPASQRRDYYNGPRAGKAVVVTAERTPSESPSGVRAWNVYNSAMELSKMLGYSYNAVTYAIYCAKKTGKEEATLRGITFRRATQDELDLMEAKENPIEPPPEALLPPVLSTEPQPPVVVCGEAEVGVPGFRPEIGWNSDQPPAEAQEEPV